MAVAALRLLFEEQIKNVPAGRMASNIFILE
jgi:hypothetical protein